MSSYETSGVNIRLGDEISKLLYNAAKATWKNRDGKIGEIKNPFDNFSGLRYINIDNLSNAVLSSGSDGIGTKVELAERAEDHSTIAYDLFAMVCDDAVVRGAEPITISTVLDVRCVKENHIKYFEQLAKGYTDAAEEAGIAIINGELAELGKRICGYGKFNYNWGATLNWIAKKDRLFTGSEIKIGDYIIAFKEEGFRSNGLSLFRTIMENSYGYEWHKEHPEILKKALLPSKIYTKTALEIFGGYENSPKAKVHGIVHITGGGIPSKLGRVLKPTNYGATLLNLFNPSEIIRYSQELGKVKDEEAYKTWNMGQGMLIITPEPDKVIEIAQNHNIEARIAGTIEANNKIKILSKGIERKIIEF